MGVIFCGEKSGFLGKPAGKIANSDHMTAASLVMHRKCEWVAKCPNYNHVISGLLQQL